jgi:Flp pilus assembly protein TadD
VQVATGADYDGLVAKADKLAVTSCAKAIELYGKALEQKPTGVEALSGIGYCYLDAKQFASANSKFRSALAVSPRFEPALAGIAEMYQQQGNKEQAIEAWQHYLESNPGSQKAQKQLQILGAGATATLPAGSGAGSATTGSGDTTPPPTPTPTPPAPTPASSGDGSAS